MAYQKTTWVNNTNPPISAANLQNMEDGIENNDVNISQLNTNIGTLSNLETAEKTNIVGAINELLDSMNWKVLGSTTGSSSLTLPSDFRELIAIANANGNPNVGFSMMIPRTALSSSVRGFNTGYYNGTSINAYIRVTSTLTSIQLNTCSLNNNNVLSASTLTVYYR